MAITETPATAVVGQGLRQGFLTESQIRSLAAEGLSRLKLDGRRVLVLIPDGTRTMPMPLMFEILEQELAGRAAAVDFLVALGTHPPMNDGQLSALVGRTVRDGSSGRSRIYNHRWDDEAALVTLGEISAEEVESITGGRMRRAVPVRLNRLILDYDHILICGPVFPHEVAGFSGGAKYFFPGIAGPEMIHITHWLGALLTSFEIIGTPDTLVRAMIHRAAEFVDRPHSLMALVVRPEGTAGLYCGPTLEAWSAAAELSGQRHVVWLKHPVQRALAVMPAMYTDLWTGAKGMYKLEPVIADGGELVIYAPHIREVSSVHGRIIDEIGYHCRDYFLAQWDRFGRYPGGLLAHSTHLKGKGAYDASTGVETPRITVTLATGISEEHCRRINLGYLDPASVNVDEWSQREDWLVVKRAGEMLYRTGPDR
jgi:nickel-dependent lactate racemase